MLENYSKAVQGALRGIKTGDNIRIKKGKNIYEGILMPRIEFGNIDCIVLKLSSGYNIGIKYEKGARIEKIKENKNFAAAGRHEKAPMLYFRKDKPPASIIVTGGTITSRVDYKTGGVTSLVKPEELLEMVPELSEIVNIRSIKSPFIKMSESMNYKDWQQLAKLTAKQLNSGDAGVILTHGTDILHYTSAALSFMLKDLSKPVVIVGSQRSSDRGSSDAAINLICASHLAASDIAEVGICMHGTINDDYCLFTRGTKVRKMHASRRDAFRPINELPLAKVYPDGRIEKMNNYRKRTDLEVKADIKFEQKVALVKFYPGASPEIIDFYLKSKYRGLVIEATGLGQVSSLSGKADKKDAWTPVLKKAIDKGMIVCFAPQTIYGRLKPFVYSEAREAYEAGVIYLEDMLPETAFVKLGWVLGHTRNREKAKEMMLTSYAGEISERTKVDTFLI